jgi:acyl-coenzyme A thioesterase PaaI-like protein
VTHEEGPGRSHPPRCLACGTANPSGLGVRLWSEGDEARGEVTLDARHAGAGDYAHGGAIAVFLDEVMGWVLQQRGLLVVTARLEVRFRSPAPLGQRFALRAWLVGGEGRRFRVKGEMRGDHGLVAEGDGTWVTVDAAHFGGLAGGSAR